MTLTRSASPVIVRWDQNTTTHKHPENPVHYEDVRECMEAHAAREGKRDPGGVVQTEIVSPRYECESE
jgi:hypothetical protein